MLPPPPHKLDYARPGESEAFPSLWAYGAALAVAALLAATEVFNLGGPYISVHAELAPVVLCLAVIVLGARGLFEGPMRRRVIIALLVFIAVGVIGCVVAVVIGYGGNPWSGGAFIGL